MDIVVKIDEVDFSKELIESYISKGNDLYEAFWYALEQTLNPKEVIDPLYDIITGKIASKGITMFKEDYETSF